MEKFLNIFKDKYFHPHISLFPVTFHINSKLPLALKPFLYQTKTSSASSIAAIALSYS